MRSVSFTAVPGIPHVAPGDDLPEIIGTHLAKIGGLSRGDILVVCQKIVSKAEGRYLSLRSVVPSARALEIAGQIGKDPRKVEAILRETREIIRCSRNLLIVEHRLGFIMANAGIDESNIEHEEDGDRVLLLPENPDESAEQLKSTLERRFSTEIGVIIADSFGRPWRMGVVGVAIGAAGVPSLVSLVGQPDLYGRPLRVTEIAIADQIAAGAALISGEADEGIPVVLVRGFSMKHSPSRASALVRPRQQDLFR